MWFAVDTLEYLRRGGRIGGAQAYLGSALKIKPILTLGEEIEPIERVRTSKRAFERMVDYGRKRYEAGADGWVVQHVQAPEEAAELVSRCRVIFGCEPRLRLGDRAGHRDPRGARPARRRRRAARAARARLDG